MGVGSLTQGVCEFDDGRWHSDTRGLGVECMTLCTITKGVWRTDDDVVAQSLRITRWKNDLNR